MSRWWRTATVLSIAVLAALLSGPARAADTVDIVLPAAVSLSVTNATMSTTGTPNPSTITFTNLQIPSGKVLRISIQANASSFTPPAGTATIPASSVSWATSNAINGTGFGGALSSSAYTEVYQSNRRAASGGVDLTWRLAAPGTSIRAGSHTLAARWRLEALVP